MAQDFTVDRASSKWVLGDSGVLVEYTSDEPAIEFNADGSYKGVLVEPASTNDCLQSEDFTTTWTTTNATITANDTTALDGTTTADKLNDDGGGGTGVVKVQQNINVSANTQYTASVFLKADQLAFARLKAEDYDGINDAFQTFGLSGSGSTGNNSGIDNSRIEQYPDGWYRCSITWTQGAADTSFIFSIFLASALTSEQVTLDGTSSVYVWGAQVEASPIATSYIPTTTGSVTRVKDDIYMTTASSLIGQTEGTLFVEVYWQDISTSANRFLLSINEGSVSNRIILRREPTGIGTFVATNGSTRGILSYSLSGYDGIVKIAVPYKTNDYALIVNGVNRDSDNTVDLSYWDTNPSLTNIDFGQAFNETLIANMHIRTVALYKTRLSDAECEALTTL